MENPMTPKEKKAAAYRAWYLKNKARRSEYNCQWDKAHRDKINQRKRKWALNNREKTRRHSIAWNRKNQSAVAAHQRAYRARNPAKIRERAREPRFRIMRSLRKRVRAFLLHKVGSTSLLFGTTPQGLRDHIQSKFSGGMAWNNYGKWHVDHIRPLSSFDLTTIEGLRAASHWTNLQPLWARDNLSKHKKWLQT